MEETTMRRAQWKWVSAAMVLAGLAAAPVAAQDFPTQPVTIVVPGAAGGGGDFVGRLLAERMSQEMSQPVIVENRRSEERRVGKECGSTGSSRWSPYS